MKVTTYCRMEEALRQQVCCEPTAILHRFERQDDIARRSLREFYSVNPFLRCIRLEEDNANLFRLWPFLPFFCLEQVLVGIRFFYYSFPKFLHVEFVVADHEATGLQLILVHAKEWTEGVDGSKKS